MINEILSPLLSNLGPGKKGDLISMLSNTTEHHTAVMSSAPDNIFYSLPD